jgi:hypothetical protein
MAVSTLDHCDRLQQRHAPIKSACGGIADRHRRGTPGRFQQDRHDGVMGAADHALQRAKDPGRHRVAVAAGFGMRW